mmetsp:Transcript_4002/g.8818  ORF Transcript_4002/g.8818 Transcript_4002/m.8818 type:complete len:95 (-) Transcript_4002:2079-2363(-)
MLLLHQNGKPHTFLLNIEADGSIAGVLPRSWMIQRWQLIVFVLDSSSSINLSLGFQNSRVTLVALPPPIQLTISMIAYRNCRYHHPLQATGLSR